VPSPGCESTAGRRGIASRQRQEGHGGRLDEKALEFKPPGMEPLVEAAMEHAQQRRAAEKLGAAQCASCVLLYSPPWALAEKVWLLHRRLQWRAAWQPLLSTSTRVCLACGPWSAGIRAAAHVQVWLPPLSDHRCNQWDAAGMQNRIFGSCPLHMHAMQCVGSGALAELQKASLSPLMRIVLVHLWPFLWLGRAAMRWGVCPSETSGSS
jgi:hypothetical protein